MMKSIQIGKLIFNKKAILLLTFCIFLNGVIIGGIAAYTQLKISGINTIMLIVMLLLLYFH